MKFGWLKYSTDSYCRERKPSVSRGRWFLDRICTHLVVFEGDSVEKTHLGNWSACETMMREKFGKDLTPHRVK